MLTYQERVDLLEIYGTLDEAYSYFQKEEPDHEIFPRFQAEMRYNRLRCLRDVCEAVEDNIHSVGLTY